MQEEEYKAYVKCIRAKRDALRDRINMILGEERDNLSYKRFNYVQPESPIQALSMLLVLEHDINRLEAQFRELLSVSLIAVTDPDEITRSLRAKAVQLGFEMDVPALLKEKPKDGGT